MLRLNGDLIADLEGTVYIIGRKTVALKSVSLPLLRVLKLLRDGISIEAISCNKENKSIWDLVVVLSKHELVVRVDKTVNELQSRSAAFLSRMSTPPDLALNNLLSMRVVLLGCGGIGANVAYYLATSGVRSFLLLDFDSVNASNLNRQFPYRKSDLLRKKTEALRSYILETNSDAEVDIVDKEVRCCQDLDCLGDQIDLIVCGIDSPAVRIKLWVAQYSIDTKVDVVFTGVGYDTISVGPLLVSSRCKERYREELLQRLANINISTVEPAVGSLGSINAYATSILSSQIIAHYGGFRDSLILNSELILDPWSLSHLDRYCYES